MQDPGHADLNNLCFYVRDVRMLYSVEYQQLSEQLKEKGNNFD